MTTRALISLSAAGAATLALAACGGDGGGGDASATPRERAQEGALKFARCMREQGIDFPDPQVGENGLVRVAPGPGRGPDPNDPKLRSAHEACGEHLESGGEAPDAALTAERQEAMLAYARCMRDEGVNVPDPNPRGGLILKAGDPEAPDPRSPAFQRADEVCHHHLAALDAEVQREGAE